MKTFRKYSCTCLIAEIGNVNGTLEATDSMGKILACKMISKNPEKNPRSKEENQQQTQPTYGTGPKSNPGHIGERRALSPLRHPRSLYESKVSCPRTQRSDPERGSLSDPESMVHNLGVTGLLKLSGVLPTKRVVRICAIKRKVRTL